MKLLCCTLLIVTSLTTLANADPATVTTPSAGGATTTGPSLPPAPPQDQWPTLITGVQMELPSNVAPNDRARVKASLARLARATSTSAIEDAIDQYRNAHGQSPERLSEVAQYCFGWPTADQSPSTTAPFLVLGTDLKIDMQPTKTSYHIVDPATGEISDYFSPYSPGAQAAIAAHWKVDRWARPNPQQLFLAAEAYSYTATDPDDRRLIVASGLMIRDIGHAASVKGILPTSLQGIETNCRMRFINLTPATAGSAQFEVWFDGVQAYRIVIRYAHGPAWDRVDYYTKIGVGVGESSVHSTVDFVSQVGRPFHLIGAWNLVPATESRLPAEATSARLG